MSWESVLKNENSVRVTANFIVDALKKLGFTASVEYVKPLLQGLPDSFSISVHKNEEYSVIKFLAIKQEYWVSGFKDEERFVKFTDVDDVIEFYENRLGDLA